jgi:acetyltransferase-like isoleucine patch superfamily enzyme
MLMLRKLKFKVCSLFARYPMTFKWTTFWWRQCGYSIGKDTVISPYCLIWATHHLDTDYVRIGNDVHIGPCSILVVRSHPKEDLAIYGKLVSQIRGNIIIEDGVWMGANVTILPNITVKKCAIVGAGSVVTKDVEPYSIVAGVPAKIIGYVK